MVRTLVPPLERNNMELIIEECQERMEKTIESLKSNLSTIRSGKVSPMILDRVMVEYYGELTPLKSIASIQTPSATSLVIRPFDPSSLKAIQQAISNSDLNVNPTSDSGVIRLNFPPLSSERRDEFVKHAKKYCEDAKIAIRNIRRDMNSEIKKDKTLSEDMAAGLNDDVQKTTDKFIGKIDEIFAAKEKELLTI